MATIYKLYLMNVDISDRNLIIDDIEDFLSSSHYCTSLTFTNSMYVRHNLNISIKLQVTKSQMGFIYPRKYCSIQNASDDKPIYYYVEKIKELSDNAFQLDLHMDVINTYKPITDFAFSPRTLIHRQHKNRFNNSRKALIDRYSENINVELSKESTSVITSDYSCDYYLAYIKPFDSEQQPDVPPKPLKCFILSDKPMRFNTDNGVGYTRTINNLNRAYPQIVKIIKLPYPPFAGFVEGTDEIVFYSSVYPNVLEYESGVWSMMKIKDDVVFDLGIGSLNVNNICPLLGGYVVPDNINKRAYRSRDYEPKIYHSDFYQPKLIYDSFSLSIECEKLSLIATSISINFKMTQTITSRFMFYIDYYKQFETHDFEDYCVIQRNNEMTILNDAYVNYILSGYNYDVKNKTRQEAFGFSKAGLSALGGILGYATGNPIFGTLSLMGVSSSLLSTFQSSLQNETNIEEKLKRASIQATSVYGADDVDLMSKYSKNKLLFSTYKVSPKVREMLLDLFHYNGYISGEYGIPNYTSRIYFNYVSCDLKLSQFRKNISAESLNELKEKYRDGVFFIHSQEADTFRNYKWWDLDREFENWETFLFN